MAAAEIAQDEFPSLDFVQYYGLSRNPFVDRGDFFFVGAGRQDLLAHLHHHCQFGTSLLVVLGEAGVGKTALRDVLAAELREADQSLVSAAQVCVVEADAELSSGQLLADIASGFGVAGASSPQDLLAAQPQSSLVEEPQRVLLVDNAHLLNESALETLVYLAREQEGGEDHWHIVLFAEPELAEHLAPEKLDSVLVHHLYVPSLHADDVKEYLDAALVGAGFRDELASPFDEGALGKLWAESQGNIGALNRMADAWLADAIASPAEQGAPSKLPLGHLLAVVVLASVLLMAFFYGGGEPEVGRNAESIPLPQLKTPAVAKPSSVADPAISADIDRGKKEPTAIAVDAEPDSPEVSVVEGVPEFVSGRAGDLASAKVSSDVVMPSGAEVSGNRVLPKSDRGATVGPTVAEKPVQLPESEAERPAVADPLAELSAAERALMALSPDRYTLQVLGAASRQSVERFVRAQSNRDSLTIYRTERQGRTWYVVVAGDYASHGAARTAIAKLPKGQREAGPWPRKLSAIQQEIKSAHGL